MRHRRFENLLVSWMLFVSFVHSSTTIANDWLSRRGPNANGLSSEKEWSDAWPATGPRQLWKTQVGIGFSSVTTKGSRVYTLGNNEDQEALFCLDTLTGRVLWKHTYECAIDDRFFEGGPTSTPTIDGNRVYSLSRQGDLFCCDAMTGGVVWSKNLPEATGVRIPGWGFSASPVVVGERLLLGVGESGLMVNKYDGEILWHSGTGEAGYMTPLLIQMENRSCAIIASGKQYQCIDVENGSVVWKHRWLTTYGCNAADPIVKGNQLFVSSGYGRGAALLELQPTATKVIWSNKEMCNQLNSSILIDEHLYGFDGDEGAEVSLKCMEFSTGKVLWSHLGLGAGSICSAADKLIVLSEYGELLVAPAESTGFRPTAKARVLEGKCWTVPVLSHGLIYCRNASGDLVCLDLRIPTKEQR